MRNICLCLLFVALSSSIADGGRLKVQGRHFIKDGQRVFLSGVNLAWIAYGYDFGNDQYKQRRSDYEHYLKAVHDAGGNSIRIWVHIEGATSPKFDSRGYVTGLDEQGTFLSDMHTFLQTAKHYNILVFFCLWNSAVKQTHPYMDGLIKDTSKLQSYIDHALVPWVKAVKDEPAMGGWDIINEMEGQLKVGLASADNCFDTTGSMMGGDGWAGKLYTPQEMERFINRQVAGIKSADPQALVTAGSGTDMSTALGNHNYYSDHCLVKAGGQSQGTLSFYAPHTYDWQGKFASDSPFLHKASDYHSHKPIVIAEFMSHSGAGRTIEKMFQWAYEKGYAGAWSWQAIGDGVKADNMTTHARGLKTLRHLNDQSKGGLVAFKI